MALPAEVLFHRFIVRKHERHPDTKAYRGRHSLEGLESSVAVMLIALRKALNDGLLLAHGLAADGENPCFYFDYIDADVMNAIAFEDEGIAFIGITILLMERLWFICERLSTAPKLTVRFEASATEQKQMLHVEMFSTAIGFVIGHEHGHHVLDHLVHRGEADPFYNEVDGISDNGNIEGQAKEVHADGRSIYLSLAGLITGDRRKQTVRNLGSNAGDEALLSLFLVSILAFFHYRAPALIDPQHINSETHPPSVFRISYVMHHIQRWCSESRQSLLPSVSQRLFEDLLWIVQDVTWGGNNVALREQAAFAQSQEGQIYEAKISAAYNALQSSLRSKE